MLDRHSKKEYNQIMEIRVLKYFLAVAREGSITGAANSLHLTQPTLTRQLQDLEKELKQKLLVRGKHKITLTKVFKSFFKITGAPLFPLPTFAF